MTTLAALLFLIALSTTTACETKAKRLNVKVFIITTFNNLGDYEYGGESGLWLDNEGLTERHTIPALNADYPYVSCRPPSKGSCDRDICLITTGELYSNAATSMMALILSDVFDLTETYFIVAAIAGVDPRDGTTGSAAWSKWVIDYGASYELDAREMPPTWPYGYTGFGPVPPGVYPTVIIGTEVYQLNELLAYRAFQLTSGLTLFDSGYAQAYRLQYTNYPNAQLPPTVLQCDSVAIDTYWQGTHFSQRANDWAALLSNGSSNYCMTDEEDSAIVTAIIRGDLAGLVDYNRLAVLRTASDFDQQYPGQTAYDSLLANSGGFPLSIQNAYLVGSTLAHEIINNWKQWQHGPK